MAAPFKRLFNMVEVTLAIAVVGIGVSGIMALFPVAITSSRDAVAQNFCADGVDQFITIVNAIANKTPDWTNTASYMYKINDDPSAVLVATYEESTTSDSGWGNIGNIYFPSATPSVTDFNRGAARLKMGSDFAAGIRFWKSPIDGLFLNGQTVNFSNITAFGGTATDKYKYGLVLHVEVSWPVQKPYANREKRYYSYELFNPLQTTN